MKYLYSCFILLLFFFSSAPAQPTLTKDYSYLMDIPSVVAMESSPAHLYVLSETEGMAVFRSKPDSLQWLYSSTGMQRRGNTVVADIRFAYLFGDSNRLSILEPTSVLGVYSSTNLPVPPFDVQRISEQLFIALGDRGLGQLSLESPSSVDSEVTFVAESELNNQSVIDLERLEDQLFALSSESNLFRFNFDSENLSLDQTFSLSEELNRIFIVENILYGTDSEGNIYEISGNGDLSKLGSIDEQVIQILKWNDWLVIKGNSNRLWTSYQNRSPVLWKENEEAGNFVTKTKGQLWLSEYNQISRVTVTKEQAQTDADNDGSIDSGSFTLQPIKNYTIPHSKSLIFPIKIEGDISPEQLQFTYQSSSIQDAEVRGQSFYWQPAQDDAGSHRVRIIASAKNGQTASETFNIQVRSFNAPPRFTPMRPMTTPVEESFSLPVNATDPDGINEDLIRYMGVNMPKGATINERTGLIEWTPTIRQVGENNFRVIATDQFGAASSIDITINVTESANRDNSDK